MPRPRLLAILALAAVLGSLISGCGARTVDPGDAAAKITAKIGEQQPALGPVTVTCPSEVRAATGTTFQCTITGPAGVSGSVDVTQTDDAGSLSIRYPTPPGTSPPHPFVPFVPTTPGSTSVDTEPPSGQLGGPASSQLGSS